MKHFIVSTAIAALLALSPVAFAAGDGGGSSGNSGGSNGSDNRDNATSESPKKLKCKKSEVIKTVVKDGKKVKACVKASAGLLTDDELYEQGRALAKEGEYDWALNVLAMIKDQNNPKVLNYTGYSHRKAGRLDLGITFYRRALAINPDFVLAREYLGEGYVAAGRLDLARIELNEIKVRCGIGCEEYKELNAAIESAM
jgi:tetratricopeptide (TPR) repeat protein